MKIVQQSDLRPYIAAVLLQAANRGVSGAALANALLQEAEQAITNTGIRTRRVLERSSASNHRSLHIASIIYVQTAAPPWLATKAVQDVAHHLAMVVVSGRRVALLASDGTMRDAMLAAITKAAPLSRKAISDAFVGAEAKTIWLNGVHARTSVKADSKALTGSALEHALDPLGDQSYILSAIRSQPPVAGLNRGKGQPVVGAAPGSSRVWLGRPETWDGFVHQVEALFDHLSVPRAACNLYEFLSQPITDVGRVRNAYGFAVLPSALLDEDVNISDAERQEAHRWAYQATYSVAGGPGLDLAISVKLEGKSLGDAQISVDVSPDGRASFDLTWSAPDPSMDDDRNSCAKVLTAPKQAKIYYDSGHAIADGQCFEVGWTDQVLEWQVEDFKGYRVDREKPRIKKRQKLADHIGIAGDTSLFSFIQKKLFPRGWLACDDGAMELADFVHFDPIDQRVTLIHVKAAGSKNPGRQVSVADYEIVVSQGVKNIRYLDRDRLVAALERGMTKDIARAVWKDGHRMVDRQGLIAAIKRLPQTVNRKLLIVQPRLTRKELNRCVKGKITEPRVLRFKQLNALMLAARLSAMAVGAEFAAIAAR